MPERASNFYIELYRSKNKNSNNKKQRDIRDISSVIDSTSLGFHTGLARHSIVNRIYSHPTFYDLDHYC
jgi:hypothetical protein